VNAPVTKLYGPNGEIIRHRTPEMIEFDRRLRQQMADNGGQWFPRELIDKIKHEAFVVREQQHKEALEQLDGGRGLLARIVDEYDAKHG
jgi:hypothetical protein